jgi:hypothetical protein
MEYEELRALVEAKADEFIKKSGSYGYGGEWFPHTQANVDRITDFTWSLLEKERVKSQPSSSS